MCIAGSVHGVDGVLFPPAKRLPPNILHDFLVWFSHRKDSCSGNKEVT